MRQDVREGASARGVSLIVQVSLRGVTQAGLYEQGSKQDVENRGQTNYCQIRPLIVIKCSSHILRLDFRHVNTQYWGSHAGLFTKCKSLDEARKSHSVKMWKYKIPTTKKKPRGRENSGYWMSAINLNVNFGHILEFQMDLVSFQEILGMLWSNQSECTTLTILL